MSGPSLQARSDTFQTKRARQVFTSPLPVSKAVRTEEARQRVGSKGARGGVVTFPGEGRGEPAAG